MSYFKGKVVLISGGASGMGYATACLLAKQGALVAIGDLNTQELEGKLPSDGSVTPFAVDVRNDEQVKAWIDKVIASFGRIDGCVNFAGIASKDFLNVDVTAINNAEWERTMDINLTGTMKCMRQQIPHLKEGGSIVNVSSVLGQVGVPMASDYNITKAGVIMLTKCAAKEVAAKGIRINAVAPGPIDTPLMAGSLKDFERVLGAPWSQLVPLGRMGKAEEVADLVEFLLSDKSTYITGSVINIDGGFGA